MKKERALELQACILKMIATIGFQIVFGKGFLIQAAMIDRLVANNTLIRHQLILLTHKKRISVNHK